MGLFDRLRKKTKYSANELAQQHLQIIKEELREKGLDSQLAEYENPPKFSDSKYQHIGEVVYHRFKMDEEDNVLFHDLDIFLDHFHGVFEDLKNTFPEPDKFSKLSFLSYLTWNYIVQKRIKAEDDSKNTVTIRTVKCRVVPKIRLNIYEMTLEDLEALEDSFRQNGFHNVRLSGKEKRACLKKNVGQLIGSYARKIIQ
ncbi:MAG: hypothetical protein KAT77_05120 [Nanoarchaeota archaeon]|nr:hypothetical protein [Nanoarchaeota archaeon]